jgi:hypothetical protein
MTCGCHDLQVYLAGIYANPPRSMSGFSGGFVCGYGQVKQSQEAIREKLKAVLENHAKAICVPVAKEKLPKSHGHVPHCRSWDSRLPFATRSISEVTNSEVIPAKYLFTAVCLIEAN